MAGQLFPLLLVLAALYYVTECQRVRELKIEDGNNKPQEGSDVKFICRGKGDELDWHFKHHTTPDGDVPTHWQLEEEVKEDSVHGTLVVSNITLRDSGRYLCLIKKQGKDKTAEANVTLHVQGRPILKDVQDKKVESGQKAVLSCTFEASPKPTVDWLKDKLPLEDMKRFSVKSRNESSLHLSELLIENVTLKDNGTYECQASNVVDSADKVGYPQLIVQDLAEIVVTARAVGTTRIHVQWTVNDNNSPIKGTEILVGSGEKDIEVWPFEDTGKQSVVLEDVGEAGQAVQLLVRITNDIGERDSPILNVTLLERDIFFIPSASPRGSTKDSLTFRWSTPIGTENDFVDYYLLSLTDVQTGESQQAVVPTADDADHLFTGLNPATNYTFKVAACLELYKNHERDCGNYSEPVTGSTMTGTPDRISDIEVECRQNLHTATNMVLVKWKEPTTSENGKVDRYKIEFVGTASYINEESQHQYYNSEHRENVGALIRNYTFYKALPNTNYTVKVYAGIRRQFSRSTNAMCFMPVWKPTPERMNWWKYPHDGLTVLKLPVPIVSQRNGTICCYRVAVVKMAPGIGLVDLPDPSSLHLNSYENVHKSATTGAYVAEAFTRWKSNAKYLLLGDGEVVGNWSDGCSVCLGEPAVAAVSTTSSAQGTAAATAAEYRSKRSFTRGHRRSLLSLQIPPHVVDGKLDNEANYTGFLMLTVKNSESKEMTSYSSYFSIVRPLDEPTVPPIGPPSQDDLIYIYVAVALFTFLLLLAIGLCSLLCFYKRRNKHLEEEDVAESLSGSLGRIFRSLRRSHTLMSQPAVDVKPIPKDELIQQYVEKLKDSELGFRREYEGLPEKFYERTSHASDMIENAPKNRYPDIKAFDQTRVKLNQINGSIGTDYINGNYVLGYKERKKFICAQGPMDTTVDDFWRMIVEQGCGVCVMLTNLEEQGKIKCVKYWPEAGQPKTFANITVHLIKEKPYSDYMVRTLRAEWGEGDDRHTHEVQQYHYLLWKDFIAPEHPTGVLSFLRRINEAYTNDKGPLLIHCSCSVSRTGTLVALDSLVQELDEEGQASIFNLICDLRHQRNFLVQSLKQYVFIHRALMEYSQFGNTELTMTQIKDAWTTNIRHDTIDEQSPLEKEFEALGRPVDRSGSVDRTGSGGANHREAADLIAAYGHAEAI
ncbi:unnamed protein product, partial [Meganyctiphanes norvegica]